MQMIRFLTIVFLILVITACGSLLPAETPTPTCQIVPMPTGERVWQMQVINAPPSTIWQGRIVQIMINGGMVVAAQEVNCGGQIELLEPNLSTAMVTQRVVRVLLDREEIQSVQCGIECEFILTLPPDVQVGAHTLTLIAGFDTMDFPIEVVPDESSG